MKDLIKNIGKKKLLMITGILVGVIVLIVVCLLLYNSLFVGKSYSSAENKIINAAKEYYEKHPTLLPKSPGDEVSVNSTTLTSSGYLGDLAKLVPDDVSCTATVTVTKMSEDYRYVTKLKCGDQYETKTLIDYVKANETTVVTGQGLYDMNGELVYRGENPNNNVSFAGKNWKIVKFVNNSAVLIYSNNKLERITWDDRYNNDRQQDDGINDYSVSRVNDYLTNLYHSDDFFSKRDRLLITPHDLYVGKRGQSVQYNDGSVERSTVLEKRYIGLLPLYDYINASLDTNCNSALTLSCANYNYLVMDRSWWTMTGDADTSYKVYKIDTEGKFSITRAASDGGLRPVVYLAKDAIYAGGDGSVDHPYQVK